MLFDIGRICIKIAGRDACMKCVIVDTIDDTYVLIDGQTRRRKCNVSHLEPTKKTLNIPKGANSLIVSTEFEKEGVSIVQKKNPKQSTERPKKAHKLHSKKGKE